MLRLTKVRLLSKPLYPSCATTNKLHSRKRSITTRSQINETRAAWIPQYLVQFERHRDSRSTFEYASAQRADTVDSIVVRLSIWQSFMSNSTDTVNQRHSLNGALPINYRTVVQNLLRTLPVVYGPVGSVRRRSASRTNYSQQNGDENLQTVHRYNLTARNRRQTEGAVTGDWRLEWPQRLERAARSLQSMPSSPRTENAKRPHE